MPNRPDPALDLFIGVDPGKQGGVVVLACSQTRVVQVDHFQMPSTILDLWTLIETYKNTPRTFAWIEHVGSMPGEGHKGAFTFGRGVGQLEMAFAAARIPLEVVTPRKWQGMFSITPRAKGEPKPLLKERCRAKAQSLYPALDIWSQGLGKQRAICDALLIATFGLRTRR